MDRMKLSEKIPLLVKRQGISQAELARAIGTYPARVSEWIGGRGSPSVQQALRMSRVLEVPLVYLADDELDEPPAVGTSEAERQILSLVHRFGAERVLWRLVEVGMGGDVGGAIRHHAEVEPGGEIPRAKGAG